MSSEIIKIALRCILNSCGKLSVEAELDLQDDFKGIASVPSAIKPGRREKPRSYLTNIGLLKYDDNIRSLVNRLMSNRFESQSDLDNLLNAEISHEIGTDITLALSLAFGRAKAASERVSFMHYLATLGGFQPRMPSLLINIFSGGIHGNSDLVPFQQIMLALKYDTCIENIEVALHIYEEIEQRMLRNSLLAGYSASSGMLIKELDYRKLLQLVADIISQEKYLSRVYLGIDIAAEHLKHSNGRYRFAGKDVDGDDLLNIYDQLITEFNIKYIEDPFDPSDTELWIKLKDTSDNGALIVGDDLFATNSQYIVEGLANGIQLKMNQGGTLTATLEAAQSARNRHKMYLCLSHRSCETEDTAMCDLAVAIGADFIKIGGPRRGDRLIKYNQLLRLAEVIEGSSGENLSEMLEDDKFAMANLSL